MPVQDVGGGTMMGKANAVPYEDQAGMSEVQRKRLLMQQLLKESLSGGSGVVPDSGAIKVPDYAGAIGKVLQAYIGQKGVEAGAKEAADVAAKAQETHLQEMQKFNTQAFDSPLGGYKIEGAGQPEMAGPPRGPSEYSAMSRGNMVEALKNAALSKDPQTRQFGQDLQKKNVERMISGRIEPLNVLEASKYMIPSSMPPGFDPSQAKLQPHINVVGENVVQTTPGEQGNAVPSTPGVQYSDPYYDKTTGLPGRKNLSTNKFEPLQPTVPLTTSASKEDIDARYKIMAAGREKVIAAMGTLQNNANAKSLLKDMDPTSFGPAANLATIYNNFLSEAGWPTIPENTTREQLAGVLAKNVRDHAKALSPTSNVDVEGLRRDLGSVISSKAGVERLLDTIDQTMLPIIISHREFVETTAKNKNFPSDTLETYGVDPAKYGVDLPQMRNYRSDAPATLTGTAAFNAMPRASQEEVIQQREADPGLPHPLMYNPGTAAKPATPAKKRIKFNELP